MKRMQVSSATSCRRTLRTREHRLRGLCVSLLLVAFSVVPLTCLPGARAQTTTVSALNAQAQKGPNPIAAPRQSTGAPQSGTQAKPAKSPAEAAAGYFPNTILLTQDNTPVHFFDDLLKGKTVMINFMFTTCTGACPAMTANLAKVQEYLGERVGKDIYMISISVDPVVDTPGALKKYATNYKVKGGWFFLTGAKADVDSVLRKVGGFVEEKNNHPNLLMVGNVQTGEWAKLFAMARPSEIANEVLKVAASK